MLAISLICVLFLRPTFPPMHRFAPRYSSVPFGPDPHMRFNICKAVRACFFPEFTWSCRSSENPAILAAHAVGELWMGTYAGVAARHFGLPFLAVLQHLAHLPSLRKAGGFALH